MSSIKKEIEEGMTTVSTARTVGLIIIIVAVGSLLLGISLGGFFF